MAYQEHNHEDIGEMMHGLVAKYRQEDVFTCDVTELAFRRSPMADGASTSLFKVVLTCNTDGTERLNPKLVCSEEMDDHTQLVAPRTTRT